MNTKNIHQTIIFKASPKDVYKVLMNSALHSKMTDSEAVIGLWECDYELIAGKR